MSEITQPHDRFLKSLLSDPEKAGVLLRERLPQEVAELLSPEPPELVEGSCVDEELRAHLTDRLFRLRTVNGRVVLLYVLIDHKSYPDRFIAWQLLKYIVEALKQWERENPGWNFLPAIVPFIFYHGEALWRIPDEFLALVDTEAGWRPYLLNFRFTTMDLSKIPDHDLSKRPKLRAWLLAAKYATREGKQLEVKEFLVQALGESGEDFFLIMRYIVETYKSFDESTVREIIRKVRPEEEENMMSQYAQDIIAKGKPEWLREGRQEEAVAILLRQLRRRFGDLPSWAGDRVSSAGLDTLENWSDRILEVQSIEEFFGEDRQQH